MWLIKGAFVGKKNFDINKMHSTTIKKKFFLPTPHAKIHSVQPLDVHPMDSNVKRDYNTHCYGCTQHSAGQLYQKSLWSTYMFLHVCEYDMK